MGYREFQLLIIFWQLGLVDTFNVIKLCVNGGSQYIGVVLSSAAGNTTELGIKSVLEPILGFGTSYQFVMAAANAVERRQRIATLASFLSASAGALTTDPTTNAAMGAAVASKIAYMKAILARGGSQELLEYVLIPSWKKFLITPNVQKTPPISHLLSPAEIQFHERCSIITQNIFAEHTNHQYIKGLAQKGRDLLPCSAPLFIQITTKGRMGNIIGFSCWGIVISAITIYSGLCLIRTAKKKHYKMIVKANELIIDTTAIDIN